nr:hypothetical protein [uncultured Sulfurimonas sp.]
MSKKIGFDEFTFVLHRYPLEVEISNEDYKLLENKDITLEDIIDKYDVEYDGYSEQLDDCEIEDYHYENLHFGLETYGDWEDIT